MELTARCECGNVSFRAAEPPVMQLVCHCADCREALGTAQANTAFFRTDACSIAGELAARAFTAASGSQTTRDSCRACGSVMFDRSEGFPTLVGVTAERLLPPFAFEPSCHVWTRSQAPDAKIDDELPQYPENLTR